MVSFAWVLWSAVAMDEPIDFRPDVATAPTLVRLLAEKTGLKLKTNGNVANDVVGIVAPKNSPREIMDQLAYTIEAKWIEAGGEWTLVRTDDQTKAQEAKSLALNLERLKAAIKKLPEPAPWTDADAKSAAMRIDTFQKQNSNGNPGSQYATIRDLMPGQRLLTRFMKVVDPQALAAIKLGERVVFSAANPTKMQRQMPMGLTNEIKSFADEARLLADSWIESSDEGGRYFLKPTTGTVSKLLVSVTRSSLQGLRIDLQAFNEKGVSLTEAMMSVDSEFGDNVRPEKVVHGDKLVELRPMSKVLLSAAQQAISGRPFVPTDEVRQHFNHPKDHEPMSLVNTEGMQALAAETGKPFIAIFPEPQIFGALVLAPDGKLTVRRFQQSLNMMGATLEDHGGWTCYREADPVLGRRRRIDRAAMDAYFRRIDRDKRSGLDAFAEFVLKHPTPLEDTMFPIYMMLTGSSEANFRYEDDLNIVRLYGLLAPQQKEALRKGEALPITAFSPDQAKVISKYLYGKRYQSMSYDSVPSVAGDPSEPRTPWNTVLREPTEAFPNGIADPFTLSAVVTDSPSWFRKEYYGENRPVTAHQVAWEQLSSERIDLFPYMANQPQRQDLGYIQGQARQWSFKLRISKSISTNADLSDHTIPNGPYISRGNLPASFKEEIDKQLAELRKQYKDVKPGDFGVGRGSPPPGR